MTIQFVRAKMQASKAKGIKGNGLALNAVYEGDSELQKISENAQFWNASPSGYFNLIVDEATADRFENQEEYFIDMYPSADPPLSMAAVAGLLRVTMHKRFRSDPNPNFPDGSTQFRLFSSTPGVDGDFSITIQNSTAIAFLDQSDVFTFIAHKAIGRRSDAEIAILRRKVDESVKFFREHLEKAVKETDPTRRNYDYGYIVMYARKRLARAEGHPTITLRGDVQDVDLSDLAAIRKEIFGA